VTLIKALEKSMNTPMVALGAIVEPETVLNAAVRSGVPADTPGLLPVLSTIIGTSSPTPLDMAAAYSTFAARGLATNTSAIKQVIGEDENVLWEFTPRPQQVFDAPIMDEINFGLARVVTRGTGFAATGVGRPVAGKTGTSDDNLSAWFVGYTPQIATSVMMVREDESGRAISLRGTGGLGSVTGGSFPARIFTQYMRNAHKELPVVNFAARIKIEGTTDYSTYFTNPGEPLPTDETTLDPGPAPGEEAVPGPKG
jgi:membrane peptidoglycan carboxypeptidase